MSPYAPPNKVPDGLCVKKNWTSILLLRGLYLGALIPIAVGTILILSVTNFSLADRESPSCGTAAAGGILVILFGTPVVGLFFAAIGGVLGFVIDSIRNRRKHTN